MNMYMYINKLSCWYIDQNVRSTSVGSDISYRVDPDQAALTTAAWSGSALFAKVLKASLWGKRAKWKYFRLVLYQFWFKGNTYKIYYRLYMKDGNKPGFLVKNSCKSKWLGPIFQNIFKYMIFRRHQKALLWSKRLIKLVIYKNQIKSLYTG